MTDVLAGRIFYRNTSTWIVKKLVNTSVSPNQCSLFSFLLSLVAGGFFLLGVWPALIIGAIIWHIGELFDFVDGDLARAKGMASKFGELGDTTFDSLKKPLLIYSLAFGYFFIYGDVLILLLATIAMVNLYFIDITKYAYEKAKEEKKAVISVGSGGVVIGYLDTLSVIAIIGVVFNQTFWVLVAFAFLPIIISVKRAISIYKLIKKATL